MRTQELRNYATQELDCKVTMIFPYYYFTKSVIIFTFCTKQTKKPLIRPITGVFYFSLRLKPSVLPPFGFENARNRPFQPHLILKTPEMIPFLPIYFSLGLKRFILPVFIFRWPFPASGQPFLFFVDPFPHRDSHFNFSLALSRVGTTIFNCNTTQNRLVLSQHNHFSAKIK